ncbi:MAG: hypothetical protein U0703_17740 [Anaerolineae bacterium]
MGVLKIMPFVGYSTPNALILKGRVLRDKHISPPMASASLLTNLVDTYKRFQSDEIPGATIRARFGDHVETATTNDERLSNSTCRRACCRRATTTST